MYSLNFSGAYSWRHSSHAVGVENLIAGEEELLALLLGSREVKSHIATEIFLVLPVRLHSHKRFFKAVVAFERPGDVDVIVAGQSARPSRRRF